LIVIFAIRGYYFHLANRRHVWGNMQRRGFKESSDAKPKTATV